MTDCTDYFTWLNDGGWIRVSARAIILNGAGDRILLEKNVGLGVTYLNFIGGGVETNETLLQCLKREMAEETDAQIVSARYLFVVENFIPHGNESRHSLEHYFQIELDRERVTPVNDGVEMVWVSIEQLGRWTCARWWCEMRLWMGAMREFGIWFCRFLWMRNSIPQLAEETC